MFNLKEDNNYNIILNHGKHGKISTERETGIFIDDIGYEVEGFKVTEAYSEVIKDSITVSFFRRGIASDYDKYYLGFKANGENKFTYLSYETLLFDTENVKPFGFNGFLSIKIPRAEVIQFVLEKEGEEEEKYHLDQFKISKNAANVYVNYREISDKTNPFNSKLFVAEIYGGDRKILDIDSRAFSTVFTPSTYVKRTSTDSFADWEIPQLVKKEVYKKFKNPKYIYNPILTISPFPRNEEYKKYEFNTLKEAISTVKADKSKILLVFSALFEHIT